MYSCTCHVYHCLYFNTMICNLHSFVRALTLAKAQKIQGSDSISSYRLTCIKIPIIKVRRSDDRLILIMGIPVLWKTVFIMRRGPSRQYTFVSNSWTCQPNLLSRIPFPIHYPGNIWNSLQNFIVFSLMQDLLRIWNMSLIGHCTKNVKNVHFRTAGPFPARVLKLLIKWFNHD